MIDLEAHGSTIAAEASRRSFYSAAALRAPPDHDDYLRRARFPSIDGLRCLAVLPVVWHHATPWPPPGLLGRGPLGVDLFFAISGFLITTLLLRERRTYGGVAVGRFYARRALRIFPAYYVVLALTSLRAIAWMPGGPVRDHFLRSLPYWATYTANWFVDFDVGHAVIFAFAWSLATEEQFYAVWPWLVRAPRWVMPVAALALVAAGQSVQLGWIGGAWPALARRIVASIASPICLGALIACALDSPRGFAMLRPLFGLRAAAPAALVALVALIVDGSAPLLVIAASMTLLVAACAVLRDHGLRAALEARPLRFVGAISYELYLVHVGAITAVKRVASTHAGDAPFVFICGLALAVPLAYALHLAVDAPLLPLRARLRARSPSGSSIPRSAYGER
jgi:peptidoglycan/LPS O-acetylase OafA/YrhL